MPLYRLVSAIDPMESSDITSRINDGVPETPPEWIHYNGLTHFKIKLNGDDRKWDVERVPAANEAWKSCFPGIFKITDETMDTSERNGMGLGAVQS